MIGDVVAVSIFAAIFISTACAQTVDENSLVPVSKIAGTNLYTGIYYKMSMKTYPYGWVTLAPYGATTYVQIELNPNELPNYEPGKTLQHNNQWYFEAVGSNVGYTLTNRVKADDVLTYSGWYSTVSNRNGIKASGDAYMIAAQWKLKAIPEEDYYKIESMQYPGCLLTWAWAMHNKYNYYIQLSYTDFKDHSMFSFKLPKITLKANVTNFQFGQLSQEVNKVLVDTKTYPNVGRTDFTYPLNETYQTTNSFTFTFDNPIGDVNETTINVNNLNELSETELIFTGGFEANEERTIEIVKGLPFNPQLKVPPYSETEIRVFTIWSKIEVPFTASLILSGTTERIVKDQRAQVQEAPVPADLLKEYLRYEGQDNLEIVSRTGNKLHISVKGTMKANVAYRTNFESKSLTKDEPKVTKATPLVTLNLALGK